WRGGLVALKGARSDLVQGVKGSKPRLRRPKLPRRPETAVSAELGEEYLRKRNALLDLKYKREAMLLARDRDQLIEKELVTKQLSYLLIAMRQKILALPRLIGNRFGDRDVPIREVVEYAKQRVNETLIELAKLPECVEPNWLEKLEEGE